jgi:hypothetical protein
MTSFIEKSQPAERDLPPAKPVDHSNALAAMAEARQRIPGDIVNKATADLPDNQRSAIRRFHAHYIENDLSIEEAAKLIRLSGSTLSLVLRGKYNASLDNVVAEIDAFFDLQEKRSQGRKLQFIPTKLTERIWQVCAAALEFQRIAYIFGDSQVGKTEALEAYARTHNHGSTIYVAVPTGGALSHFLVKLAEKLRISAALRETDLRRRIIEAFDDRMLLIVDEAHRCVPQSRFVDRRIQTIEFIREIFDERKCGVVICATKAFQDAMERGALANLLKQTKRRRLCAMHLPDRATREDLNTFAAAYDLAPSSGAARELETRLIDEEALGMWLTVLRMAAKLAAQRKQKLAWAHVLSAWAGLQQLEGTSTK